MSCWSDEDWLYLPKTLPFTRTSVVPNCGCQSCSGAYHMILLREAWMLLFAHMRFNVGVPKEIIKHIKSFFTG